LKTIKKKTSPNTKAKSQIQTPPSTKLMTQIPVGFCSQSIGSKFVHNRTWPFSKRSSTIACTLSALKTASLAKVQKAKAEIEECPWRWESNINGCAWN
jgi:hypothetical protein